MGLPAVVEELVADRFTLNCCGPKTAPNALVASYEWDHYFDLLTIRDEEAYAELLENMIENWRPHRSVRWSRGLSLSSA